ncbi:RNA polymerase II transcription factor-like protein [Pleomassaria siparia CBS 279.74]|uniref:RNA polymerase II transcription factor-like protein n=1 Tax=Pleomassaria siparia CBS 279.74 TaxID=1314801 RepID=A0A6G1K3A4_9PLEO|nr:RNA polymerase II transcription factor-like protein [Pleomassaria siparia CBS 279.74]
MSEAAAQYKKQDGMLSVSADGRTVSWTSKSGASSPVLIAIADTTNLQQTPPTAAKASIKVVVQKPGAPQPENYMFTFTSATARDDQQSMTSLLRKWIEAYKARDSPAPAPTTDAASGLSAALAAGQVATGSAKPQDDTYDDSRLMRDIELQKSLLNSNPVLRQRFDQALRDKPETITIVQFSNQFWATRVHLLRSHAAERSQGAGTYNVLSVVRPKHENGELKLNMSKEQIQLIFIQHPLVKRVYNENVPPLSEGDFWSRFFHSRLVKKLRGEKIVEVDSLDPKLDKYLAMDEDADSTRLLTMSHIPHFIDVEANEQNHSQRLGNRPDWTMRPNTNEKVPILRVLNRMSEKMMADVPSADGQTDRHAPVGVDEETYKQLQLKDLQRAADDNRVILKINDQGQLFSAGQGLHTSSSASTYAERTPAQVLSTVQHEFRNIWSSKNNSAGLNLQSAIGVKEDSSSDEESTTKKKVRVGSRCTRNAATSHIMKAIRKRRLNNDDYTSSLNTASSEQAAGLGLSASVFDNLAMTHNTTVEFLHYFWAVFLSGDADRANEASNLIETLDRSLDRIKAVAETAESERAVKVDKHKRDNDIYAQRTGKRRKFDPNSVKGGANTVNEIVAPLIRAIGAATAEYKRALQQEQKIRPC